MIHARKDYNRIQDPENLIPEDEPVFLLRGQDVLAPDILHRWAETLINEGGNVKMAVMVKDHADLMLDWQAKHGSKLPDLPPPEEVALVEIAKVLGKYKEMSKGANRGDKAGFPNPGSDSFEMMKSEILSVINSIT